MSLWRKNNQICCCICKWSHILLRNLYVRNSEMLRCLIASIAIIYGRIIDGSWYQKLFQCKGYSDNLCIWYYFILCKVSTTSNHSNNLCRRWCMDWKCFIERMVRHFYSCKARLFCFLQYIISMVCFSVKSYI